MQKKKLVLHQQFGEILAFNILFKDYKVTKSGTREMGGKEDHKYYNIKYSAAALGYKIPIQYKTAWEFELFYCAYFYLTGLPDFPIVV